MEVKNIFDAENLRRELFNLRDEDYRNFQAKLIPNVDREKFIGICTPVLCSFAKKYFGGDADKKSFLDDLPHKYFEENSLHALIVSEMKDFDECLTAVKNFLPHVDNWGICDSISPKVFKRHTDELDAEISNWLSSKQPYTVRFGLSMLMKFYLGEKFDVQILERAAAVHSENYYVNMMSAWLFATALAKHFDATIKFLSERKLSPQVHGKTIRKALESRRVTDEQKNFLRGRFKSDGTVWATL